MDQWRLQHLPMMKPMATSGAANGEVVPLRLRSLGPPFGNTRAHRQHGLQAVEHPFSSTRSIIARSVNEGNFPCPLPRRRSSLRPSGAS